MDKAIKIGLLLLYPIRARTHKYYLGNTFNMWHETDHKMKCNKVETIKSSN